MLYGRLHKSLLSWGRVSLIVSLLCLGCRCSDDHKADDRPSGDSGEHTSPDEVKAVEAFPDLAPFDRPVDLQVDPSGRFFVVEQHGRIHAFSAGEEPVEILDIEDVVFAENDERGGNEQGLLGLAFHPNYAGNRHFFVNYTEREGDEAYTVIARYTMNEDGNAADPATRRVLLRFKQPDSNHNGGALAFGADNMLYIAVGDGGSSDDPDGNGQNLETWLGSILRIDVDGTEAGNYSVPSDNPFVTRPAARPEIWAYGLRNPWRLSFDGDALWVGDVGQNKYEEVNLIKRGGNYGWNTMEGSHCFSPAEGCDREGLELPVVEYDHDQGQSITGGYVYRGSRVKSLQGGYVYGDFVSGRVWALKPHAGEPPQNVLLLEAGTQISTFGVDQEGELYFCGFDGKIYHLAPA